MAEMIRSFPKGEGAERMPSPLAGNTPGDQALSEAKDVAASVAGQAKELVGTEVARRAERSANDISDVARALRQTKQGLQDNIAAPYIDTAADQLERLSRFLRTADAPQMVRSVETFARREPLVFLGGAFALGMLAARFLKSSAHHGAGWSGSRGRQWGREEYGRIERGYGAGPGAGATPSYGYNTGPRGAGEWAGTGEPDIGATAPDPRGDYPPNNPPGGPYPGSAMSPMERQEREKRS